MDFGIPQEYSKYQTEVTDFASQLDTSDLVERDQSGVFPVDLWRQCGTFGLLGLAAESKYGGTFENVKILKSALAMEGFGSACKDNGLGLAINAHLWTVQMSISEFGSEILKQKYLPKMCTGEWIGAHALTEAESGSDVFSLQTTATKVDGGYILNGKKRLVTMAPIANVTIVFASTDLSLGKWGITAFVLDDAMKGYIRKPVNAKMGLRTVPIGELEFDNCFVPEENILGNVGAGMSICNRSLEFDRCCVMASKLGAMSRQLTECTQFVKSHKRFGSTIGSFQAISHRIADMKLRLELCRLLLYKTAWLKDQGKSVMLEGAMLKLYLGESFVASSLDAVRLFGGSGYLTEYEIERDLRDSVGGVLYAGTSDVQKNIIAAMLGL